MYDDLLNDNYDFSEEFKNKIKVIFNLYRPRKK